MKRILLFSIILVLSSSVFAAQISTDKQIYESGETIFVTISDCPDGTSVTANIPRIWASQGVISGGSWTTSYVIPSSFDTGDDLDINGYCEEELSTTFCVNPDCEIAATNEGGDSSGGSSSSGSSSSSTSSSGSFDYSPTTNNVNKEVTTRSTPNSNEAAAEVVNYNDDSNDNTMMYVIAAVILIAIIAGGFYFYKKKKATQSGAGYVNYPNQNQPMNNQPMNNQPMNNQNSDDQNNNQY